MRGSEQIFSVEEIINSLAKHLEIYRIFLISTEQRRELESSGRPKLDDYEEIEMINLMNQADVGRLKNMILREYDLILFPKKLDHQVQIQYLSYRRV